MSAVPKQARTVGTIARDCGTTTQRVDYIVRTRGIREIARAGCIRLFDEKAQARIRYELNAIDARRCR